MKRITVIRKPVIVTLVAVTIFAVAVFAIFKVMTRWDPDEEWAAKIVEESTEVRLLLEQYREENGEFPMSLSDLDEDYKKPTDYLTRNGAAPDTDRWFYDRIGKNDYQLFVTADSWVSSFDAMVYRHTGEFADPWFSTLVAHQPYSGLEWEILSQFGGIVSMLGAPFRSGEGWLGPGKKIAMISSRLHTDFTFE